MFIVSVPYNLSGPWFSFPEETQGAKTYWLEHGKVHEPFKKNTVKVYSEKSDCMVNAKYCCNVWKIPDMIPDKKMIPDMNRLAKHNQYLFMQKGARARTAELTVEMLKHKKQVRLLEPRHWPPNCPDLNSVHFRIWRTGI